MTSREYSSGGREYAFGECGHLGGMGQALHRARGAVARYGQATSRPQQPSIEGVAEEDRPIRIFSVGVRKRKTAEQIEAENRWTEKARMLYGQPKQAPDLKARLRAREAKVTDYQPEPPYDKPRPEPPYDQPQPPESDDSVREWNKEDPNYKFMVQKVAAKVTTRSQNVGPEVTKAAERFAPKPLSRAKVSQEEIEGRTVPGKLNIVQLKQAYLLYQGRAQGEVKQLSVEEIAHKYDVNVDLLRKLFKYTSFTEGKPVEKEAYSGNSAKTNRLS